MSKPTPQEQRLKSFQDAFFQLSSFHQKPTPRTKGLSYFNSPSYWLYANDETLENFQYVGMCLSQMNGVKKAEMEKAIGELPTYGMKDYEAAKHLMLNVDECNANKPLSVFTRVLA